jgi:hypothetical protein
MDYLPSPALDYLNHKIDPKVDLFIDRNFSLRTDSNK